MLRRLLQVKPIFSQLKGLVDLIVLGIFKNFETLLVRGLIVLGFVSKTSCLLSPVPQVLSMTSPRSQAKPTLFSTSFQASFNLKSETFHASSMHIFIPSYRPGFPAVKAFDSDI